MADEKDRFGETMRLVERAKEDIYFAERDRALLEKLRGQLRKVEKRAAEFRCPKCPGQLETYNIRGVPAGSLSRAAAACGWTQASWRLWRENSAADRSASGSIS